jgi:hypothetical protein
MMRPLLQFRCSMLCIVDQFTELCEAELFTKRFGLSVDYHCQKEALEER